MTNVNITKQAVIELVQNAKGLQVRGKIIRVEIVRRKLGIYETEKFPLTMAGFTQATQWRDEIVHKIENGLPLKVSKKSITIAEALTNCDNDVDVGWNKTCSSNWSQVGFQKGKMAETYFGPKFLIEDIDSVKIKEYKTYLKGLKRGKQGGLMKNSTVNKYLDALRKILRVAEDDGKFSGDPSKSPPKISKLTYDLAESHHRGFFFDLEAGVNEEKDFYDAAKILGGKYLELAKLVRFGVKSGMRINEILTLLCRDINLTRNTINISGTKTKNHERRTLKFDAELKAIIKYFMGNRVGKHTLIQSKYPAYNKRDGEFHIWNNSKIDRYFATVKAHAGIDDDDLTFHSSRNTFILRGLEEGIKPHIMMRLVGHKNIETTMGYVSKQLRLVSDKDLEAYKHPADATIVGV